LNVFPFQFPSQLQLQFSSRLRLNVLPKLYERTNDELTLDEIKKLHI